MVAENKNVQWNSNQSSKMDEMSLEEIETRFLMKCIGLILDRMINVVQKAKALSCLSIETRRFVLRMSIFELLKTGQFNSCHEKGTHDEVVQKICSYNKYADEILFEKFEEICQALHNWRP